LDLAGGVRSHSGPEFDQRIPVSEDGVAHGLGIPSIRERIERFVGGEPA
jgi:hypothetical protein